MQDNWTHRSYHVTVKFTLSNPNLRLEKGNIPQLYNPNSKSAVLEYTVEPSQGERFRVLAEMVGCITLSSTQQPCPSSFRINHRRKPFRRGRSGAAPRCPRRRKNTCGGGVQSGDQGRRREHRLAPTCRRSKFSPHNVHTNTCVRASSLQRSTAVFKAGPVELEPTPIWVSYDSAQHAEETCVVSITRMNSGKSFRTETRISGLQNSKSEQ